MKHYILVRWRQREGETRRTLVNLHKIVTVVGAPQGCKIHFQGYCLDVEDSFEDVIAMIEAAEAEGSRKPGRPLMGTAARERQGEAPPPQRRAQWAADWDGWPYCSACGCSADIDREAFRMRGDIRAAEPPYCPACGALLAGKDTNVPGSQGRVPGAAPERKQTFRSGEEEPGESSSIAAPAAMRSIPPSSDDGGGGRLMSGRPRKKLPMSDEEIRREYRLAKDQKKQLKILADENACSVSTIRSIVFADQLGGFIPIQAPAEKEAEKEKDGVKENDSIPLRVTADPEWPPLPSAPPQAASDFDELGPSSLPDVQDIPEASAAPGPDSPEEAPDAAAGSPHQSPAATASPQGKPGGGGASAAVRESGYVFRISRKDLSRMWHILGRLQGVLEASAEAGKPGEVMKDACDELEVLLMSLGENDPF